VDKFILLSEQEIKSALKLILIKHYLLIEGAAALPVAAFLKNKEKFAGQNVVLVISGAEGIDFAIIPVVRKMPDPITIPIITMVESKRPSFRSRVEGGLFVSCDILLNISILFYIEESNLNLILSIFSSFFPEFLSNFILTFTIYNLISIIRIGNFYE